ncbi:MAG: prepilin-type N-terminal cleavage/methylation domain-containing protein [Candidatus Palauibacterales bacterium]|nr:prepilin-type N-terminal cleavage/methylation domain-containing protein [Candidatus Palauibacterales bacterium]MDP2482642.1 prepilin-type N-terminal cleavage/methylation domain-containing protein [Candidatus Palauibacterales bacterium]
MRSPAIGKDSDTDSGVMHGDLPEMPRGIAYFRRFEVVAFLHPEGVRAHAEDGFGLVEVIVALTVLCLGVLGVVGLGSAAHRMAQVGAVRSAQTILATAVLEGGTASVPGALEVSGDSVALGSGVVEIRVTVNGSAWTGPRTWVTRRPARGP